MAPYEAITRWIKKIHYLKTQEVCNEAVGVEPRSLTCLPDRFKTQETSNEAVPMYLYLLGHIQPKFAIFFYLFQYFMKLRGRDTSILHCLRNDIGYAV